MNTEKEVWAVLDLSGLPLVAGASLAVWLIAGLLLYIEGLTYQHKHAKFIRIILLIIFLFAMLALIMIIKITS